MFQLCGYMWEGLWFACAMSKPHRPLRCAAARNFAIAPAVQQTELESRAQVSSNGVIAM